MTGQADAERADAGRADAGRFTPLRRRAVLVPPGEPHLRNVIAVRGMAAALAGGADQVAVGCYRLDAARAAGVLRGLPDMALAAGDSRQSVLKIEGAAVVDVPTRDTLAETYEAAGFDPAEAFFDPVPGPRAAGVAAVARRLAAGRRLVLVADEHGRRLRVPRQPPGTVVLHVYDPRLGSRWDPSDLVDLLRAADRVHALDGPVAALACLGRLAPVTVHAYAGAEKPALPYDEVLTAPPAEGHLGQHFLGWRGDAGQANDDEKVRAALREGFRHFEALQTIMEPTAADWRPCGSYLMGPASMDYDPSTLPKQAAYFRAVADMADRGRHSVLEIGVHGGHSVLLALLADPACRVTCVDLCAWPHTAECVAYLQAAFPGRVVLLRGDSAAVLPMMQADFDLVHVDGDHGARAVRRDVEHALRLARPDATFVIDDYHVDGVPEVVHDLLEPLAVPECPWANCLARRKPISA